MFSHQPSCYDNWRCKSRIYNVYIITDIEFWPYFLFLRRAKEGLHPEKTSISEEVSEGLEEQPKQGSKACKKQKEMNLCKSEVTVNENKVSLQINRLSVVC